MERAIEIFIGHGLQVLKTQIMQLSEASKAYGNRERQRFIKPDETFSIGIKIQIIKQHWVTHRMPIGDFCKITRSSYFTLKILKGMFCNTASGGHLNHTVQHWGRGKTDKGFGAQTDMSQHFMPGWGVFTVNSEESIMAPRLSYFSYLSTYLLILYTWIAELTSLFFMSLI